MSYKKKERLERSMETMEEVATYPCMAIKDRGILKEVAVELGIRTKVSQKDGVSPIAHYFPVTKKGVLTGYIRRDLKTRKVDSFSSVGDVDVSCDMLGQSKCSPSGGNKLFVVEGIYDWASAFQVLWLNQKVPKKYTPSVVSVLLGTANAVDNMAHNQDFIGKYKETILVLDSDRASEKDKKKGIIKGQDAVEEIIRVFPDALNVVLSRKDPNEFIRATPENNLTQDANALYCEMLFQAKAFEPDDFVEGSIEADELYKPLLEGVYVSTMPKTSKILHGFRKAEMTVILAPAGVGKTTLITEVAYPLLAETKYKVDMIYAEEDVRKAQQRFIALGCNVPLNKFRQDPTIVPLEQREKVRKQLIANDRTAWLDTKAAFGKIDPDRLLKRLAWSAAKGYDFAFIDHLTMMVYSNSEVNKIDEFLMGLAQHVTSTGQGVIAVSHITRRNAPAPRDKEGNIKYPYWINVRKEDARGAGSYEQLAWNIICIEPEILENGERGRVRVRVDKNREWGYLGISDVVRMNEVTGRIEQAEDEYNY